MIFAFFTGLVGAGIVILLLHFSNRSAGSAPRSPLELLIFAVSIAVGSALGDHFAQLFSLSWQRAASVGLAVALAMVLGELIIWLRRRWLRRKP
jgi:hypothetical protein